MGLGVGAFEGALVGASEGRADGLPLGALEGSERQKLPVSVGVQTNPRSELHLGANSLVKLQASNSSLVSGTWQVGSSPGEVRTHTNPSQQLPCCGPGSSRRSNSNVHPKFKLSPQSNTKP